MVRRRHEIVSGPDPAHLCPGTIRALDRKPVKERSSVLSRAIAMTDHPGDARRRCRVPYADMQRASAMPVRRGRAPECERGLRAEELTRGQSWRVLFACVADVVGVAARASGATYPRIRSHEPRAPQLTEGESRSCCVRERERAIAEGNRARCHPPSVAHCGAARSERIRAVNGRVPMASWGGGDDMGSAAHRGLRTGISTPRICRSCDRAHGWSRNLRRVGRRHAELESNHDRWGRPPSPAGESAAAAEPASAASVSGGESVRRG